MTDDSKNPEIEHLLNELYELRVSLGEISRKVSRNLS